jgi:olefin beta-lactone synthetase
VTENPNIAARLAERAARHPARPAIVEGRGGRRRSISFGELADRVARTGEGLRRQGLTPGDRVLLFVPMSTDLYATLLGVLHAGGVAVFVDAWAGRERLAAAVDAAAPRLFVGTWKAQLLRWVTPALRRIPGSARPGRLPAAAPAGQTEPAAVVQADDHALVTFTTGSTGRPRAAARSHAFLWAQHRVLARHLALRDEDVDMPTLPIFVLNNLALGVTTVLPHMDPRRPADADPAAVLAQMRDEGVTTTSGSPAFYQRLAEHVSARGETIPVRALFTGGAPVFPPLARALAAATAGEVHVLYGSTEAEPIASIPALELAERSESPGAPGVCAGRPVDEIELRIEREMKGDRRAAAQREPPGERPPPRPPVPQGPGGGAAEVPQSGEVGEIVVSGEHVLGGYLNDPEGDAAVKIREGDRVWHRTGDGGWVDEGGRLWLLGRVGQRVEREGGTWWPMAAEARALSVPGVRHAAYLGQPRPGGGTAAVLCVEVEGAAMAGVRESLEARLRVALAPIPVDQVRVLDRVPRDPRHASKTDVPRLRELLSAG